jgi:pimeloyl-ACP methyl ester carboxylesterase
MCGVGARPGHDGGDGGRVECGVGQGGTSDADRARVGRWRSERAAARFRMMEDALWREATGPAPTEIDVHTRFGVTRAYRWAGNGTPIVFLHGGGMTSVSWARYAKALSNRDVYAVDIMGDAGRSEPAAWIACAADMAAWLDETLEGLRIERAHLVGHSLGGYVALSTAAYRPDRVSSLVLLDPAGIAPINMLRFMAWGVPVLLGSLAPARVRRWLGRRLRNPMLENKRASRLLLHGMVRHAPGFPLLKPLRDDELRTVSVPVALLIATESEPFDPDLLAARADALLPQVSIERLPDAGHALIVSHFDICAARIALTDT